MDPLLWSSFNSFFELAAAFCFTYGFIEPFTAHFNKKVYEIDNFFLSSFVSSSQSKEIENYKAYCRYKSSQGKIQKVYDPLNSEIKIIIDRFRIAFFHSFLTCVIFLLISGFENFYLGHSQIDAKFCGLIIIPFISLLIYCFMLDSLKSEEQVKQVLENWKEKLVHTVDPYGFVLALLLSIFFLGFLVIAYMDGDTHFFSKMNIRWITLICMFLIVLPFLIQYFQFKKIVKRYEKVASELLPQD